VSSFIKIYNESNAEEYVNLLNERNISLDIYFYPKFLKIDAEIQYGKYEIFTVVKYDKIFIYPYIKLGFQDKKLVNYFDLTSPYGYCGPYCNEYQFLDEAEQLFLDYIKNNCITEFIRYHYLYNENLKFGKNIQNFQNRTIVTLNLTKDWEEIWNKEYSGTNRNLVRKLEKEGFEYSITEDSKDFEEFIEMYYSTMTNAGANSFYYFEKSLIHELNKNLGEKIFLAKVQKEGVTYCYSLFFVSGKIGTYYLSARNITFNKVPSTNFLLSKTVEFLKSKNITILNFGGGLTNDLNDPLFKFKSNFSKSYKDFYIGKRIHNHEVYNTLVNEWILLKGVDDYHSRKNILQFYR
jgi:hypothetical protein